MNKMNKTESAVKELYQQAGFKVIKPSWPDLLAVKEGKIILIEVKDYTDRLSAEQIESFDFIQTGGLEVRCVKFKSASLSDFKDTLFDKQTTPVFMKRRAIHWRNQRIEKKEIPTLDINYDNKGHMRAVERDKEGPKRGGNWGDFLEPSSKSYIPDGVKFTPEDEKLMEAAIANKDAEVNEFLNMLPKGSPKDGST